MSFSAQLGIATRSLRRPDFFRLWSGLGLSQIGSQVTLVAVAYQVYQLSGHSALSLGLVGLFRFIPIALASGVTGQLADQRDRRSIMLATQSLLCLNSAAMALVSAAGWATPLMIYGFVMLSGLAFAFDAPARHSLVPGLVTPDELPNALSLNITVFQVATVVGPALGGVFLRWGGPKLAYAVDAVSYAALLVQLLRLKYRAPVVAKPLRLSFGAFRDGLIFMRSRPELIWLMSLDFVATFFAGSMLLMPMFADKIFHVGVNGLGLLYAGPAVGAVLAALVMSGRPPIERQGLVVLVSVGAYGLSIAAFGAVHDFGLGLFFLAGSGASDTVSMVVRNTVRQLRTPDNLRGRMTSLNQLFFVGGPQLGEVEAGVVAKLTSAPVSVISGGLLCIAATVLVALGVPVLRKLARQDSERVGEVAT